MHFRLVRSVPSTSSKLAVAKKGRRHFSITFHHFQMARLNKSILLLYHQGSRNVFICIFGRFEGYTLPGYSVLCRYYIYAKKIHRFLSMIKILLCYFKGQGRQEYIIVISSWKEDTSSVNRIQCWYIFYAAIKHIDRNSINFCGSENVTMFLKTIDNNGTCLACLGCYWWSIRHNHCIIAL